MAAGGCVGFGSVGLGSSVGLVVSSGSVASVGAVVSPGSVGAVVSPGSVGAVVGATFPEEAKVLRKAMPGTIFLVPGYGAQGGTADDVVSSFNSDGLGAIVNSSRKIIFAFQGKGDDRNFADYARQAAIDMREDLRKALIKEKIYRWN